MFYLQFFSHDVNTQYTVRYAQHQV